MIVCTKCQHHNADTEKFCQRCGAFLEFSGKPLTDTPKLPPPSGSGPDTSPTAVVTPSPADTQPVAQVPFDPAPTVQTPITQPPNTPPTNTGWASPSADTAAIRPDEAGVDRAYVPTTVAATNAVGPGEIACPTCGTGNQPGRTFCRTCGSELAAVATAAPAAFVDHDRKDRRKLYTIIGALVTVALVAALAIVLWPSDDSNGSNGAPPASSVRGGAATTDAATATTGAGDPGTTVAVTVPPTFPAQPSAVCGTAHYADVGTDAELAGWFLSGRLYAQCAGEQGNVVSKDGYVLFPSGPTCPDLGQGLMFIVFDQPTSVRSVNLLPSPSPTRNYRWPISARIIGYPDILTDGPTRPAQGPGGDQITRTSAKPSGPAAWKADGVYSTIAKTLTIQNGNPTPVRAIELQLLQYGDTPGKGGSPDARCAVHRIQVVG